MPIFCKDNEKIFYIHIPRTSGRYIKELFVSNGYNSKYHEYSVDDAIAGIIPTHLHYPNYNYYFKVLDIPHFTIVRNPVDKIWSALDLVYKMHNPKDFFKNLEDKSWFFDYIDFERSYNSFHNNWFTPQLNFISHKTFVYNYEDGINENFYSWIEKNFSINIKFKEIKYYKMKEEIEYFKKYKITQKIKDNILDYYIDDFRKFNY
jgi:hypothetical protein